jgi:hypothetical protein
MVIALHIKLVYGREWESNEVTTVFVSFSCRLDVVHRNRISNEHADTGYPLALETALSPVLCAPAKVSIATAAEMSTSTNGALELRSIGMEEKIT